MEDGCLECTIDTPFGDHLILTGTMADLEPVASGNSPDLTENRALLHNAWAYAKFTHLKVNLPSHEEQRLAERKAKEYRGAAEWIASVAGNLTREQRTAWCSGCLAKCSHRKSARPSRELPVWVCTECGSPSLPCLSPSCENMAVRGRGAVRVPRYCAEHRHDIPSFEAASANFGPLGNYASFLDFDQVNLARYARVAGASLALLPLGYGAGILASYAVGGAVGSLVGGYSGAAAANYGLALLGGGALSQGGFGMAGGTYVVGALGAALGAGLGSSVTHAYVREDKSFRIEQLRHGPGTPVVVCNGFLTANCDGWGAWRKLIDDRYPDSPVFRVHWGAKELKSLGILAADVAGRAVASAAMRQAAAVAAKSNLKTLGPLAPVLAAASVAKNPWHVAKSRSEKTGLILADLLVRTDAPEYVLVGHSLGARAMVVAIQALSSTGSAPRVRDAHLLGAAIGGEGDWGALSDGVVGSVFNYHSENDNILGLFYRAAQLGQSAAGRIGFLPATPKVVNVDVSEEVDSHSGYFSHISLR